MPSEVPKSWSYPIRLIFLAEAGMGNTRLLLIIEKEKGVNEEIICSLKEVMFVDGKQSMITYTTTTSEVGYGQIQEIKIGRDWQISKK